MCVAATSVGPNGERRQLTLPQLIRSAALAQQAKRAGQPGATGTTASAAAAQPRRSAAPFTGGLTGTSGGFTGA
jgi:hypothetical protein